jgi:hypothetical protein
MEGIPTGSEIALSLLDETGFVNGRAEEEQVAGAGAVRRAKTADTGLRLPVGPGCPSALQPLRILSRQRAQQVSVG